MVSFRGLRHDFEECMLPGGQKHPSMQWSPHTSPLSVFEQVSIHGLPHSVYSMLCGHDLAGRVSKIVLGMSCMTKNKVLQSKNVNNKISLIQICYGAKHWLTELQSKQCSDKDFNSRQKTSVLQFCGLPPECTHWREYSDTVSHKQEECVVALHWQRSSMHAFTNRSTVNRGVQLLNALLRNSCLHKFCPETQHLKVLFVGA